MTTALALASLLAVSLSRFDKMGQIVSRPRKNWLALLLPTKHFLACNPTDEIDLCGLCFFYYFSYPGSAGWSIRWYGPGWPSPLSELLRPCFRSCFRFSCLDYP